MNTKFVLPNQYVSEEEKQTPKHTKATADYYYSLMYNTEYKEYIDLITKAIRGQLDKNDYKQVLNPYGSDDPRLQNYPGKLRNMDIINPIIRRYMGEYMSAYRNIVVTTRPAQSNAKSRTEEAAAVASMMVERFTKQLQGQDVSQEDLQTQIEAKVKEATSVDYDELQRSEGQDMLDYIQYDTESELKNAQMWFYWICYGVCISHRYIHRDNLYKEVISPSEYYPLDNGSDYIEDHDGGMRVRRISIDQLRVRFRDILDDSDIQYLERILDVNINNDVITVPIGLVNLRNKQIGYEPIPLTDKGEQYSYNFSNTNRMVDYHHIVYPSIKRIGILKYLDTFSQELEREVPDSYELDTTIGDIEIRYEYISETREIHHFGDFVTGVYTASKPLLVQRAELNNSSATKINFGGKIGMFGDAPNHSIVLTLIPYQELINIIQLQREREIAKFISSITILPKGLLRQMEISKEEVLYYMKADGKLWIDETDDTFKSMMDAIKQFNVTSFDYVAYLGKVMEELKSDAWDAVDMNRQRYGDVNTKDGKATTEQALVRASVGSIPINEFFNKMLEREYQADLDWSKYAWINSTPMTPKGNFISSEGKLVNLIVNGEKHLGTEYGVFCKFGADEEKQIEEFKKWAFNLGQNGEPDLSAMAITSRNPAKLEAAIKKTAEALRARQDEQAQATNDATKYAADKALEMKLKELDNKILETTIKVKGDIYIKELEIGQVLNQDKSQNTLDDINNLSAEVVARNNEARKLDIAQDSNNIKREQIRSSEKIAKMNKN